MDADPEKRAVILADAWVRRGPRGEDVQLLRRLRFAGVAVDVPKSSGARPSRHATLDDVDLAVRAHVRRAAARRPQRARCDPGAQRPYGALEYQDDGTVSASVKLQELFGLADTPRIGPRKEPVRLALLAPNGRPVQTTRDSGVSGTRRTRRCGKNCAAVPEASVAGGSVDRDADGADDEAKDVGRPSAPARRLYASHFPNSGSPAREA